jgi:hypothetical protein
MFRFCSLAVVAQAAALSEVDLAAAMDDDSLSLLQLRAKSLEQNQDAQDPAPIEPFVDQQGRCCTADLSQPGQGVLGPCEGVQVGNNVLWWLRNELVYDSVRHRSTFNGPFRKMGLVDPSGRTIRRGYVLNANSDSDSPDPRWQETAAWRNGPAYTITNIECGACEDEEPEVEAPTNCPAGQIKSFFKTEGAGALCSDSGGHRVTDSAVCAAGVMGMPGSTRTHCPSTNGAWPKLGCFEFAGRLYDSTCAADGTGNAGNTFDSHNAAHFSAHNGICFKCQDDPNAPDDAPEVEAPTCPAGKIQSFFKTSGASAMCSDSGGFRLKDSAVCAAGVLGMPGSTRTFCPSSNGAWPTVGCFEFAGSLYDSTCAVDGVGNAGNTFDSHKPAHFSAHNGICFTCEDDPDAPEEVPEDEAGAIGDPHMTLSNHKKNDLCCHHGHCKPCQL